MEELTKWVARCAPELAVKNAWFCVPPTELNGKPVRDLFRSIPPIYPLQNNGALYHSVSGESNMALAYCKDEDENGECIAIGMFSQNTKDHRYYAFFQGRLYLNADKYSFDSEECKIWGPTFPGGVLVMNEPQRQAAVNLACAVLVTLFTALQAPITANVCVASPKNPHRASKGKKPLYSWHTVTIEPPKPKAKHKGGTHASPKPHDRRGCWYTSSTGKRCWRSHCKVNAKGEGFVFKDYVVKPQGLDKSAPLM